MSEVPTVRVCHLLSQKVTTTMSTPGSPHQQGDKKSENRAAAVREENRKDTPVKTTRSAASSRASFATAKSTGAVEGLDVGRDETKIFSREAEESQGDLTPGNVTDVIWEGNAKDITNDTRKGSCAGCGEIKVDNHRVEESQAEVMPGNLMGFITDGNTEDRIQAAPGAHPKQLVAGPALPSAAENTHAPPAPAMADENSDNKQAQAEPTGIRSGSTRSQPQNQSSALPLGPPEEEFTNLDLETRTRDIIIALMGPTGAGKSSFIANATKCEGQGVGHELTSCTSEINVTKYEVEGSNVVLVDTPGFDDTRKSDLDILKLISDWLNTEYQTTRPMLSAMLYFHRISDNRMAGTPLKNLRVFEKLCGKNAMSKVILVTTMWDEVDTEVGDERLKELKDNYWKMMISRGSTTFECKDVRGSPMNLLQQIVRRKKEQELMGQDEEGEGGVQLQEEISNMKLELQETAAGQQLCSRLEELARKRMETLRRIRDETKGADQKTAEDLWREYAEVKAQLDSTLTQARQLRMTLRQRIKSIKNGFHFRGLRIWRKL